MTSQFDMNTVLYSSIGNVRKKKKAKISGSGISNWCLCKWGEWQFGGMVL